MFNQISGSESTKANRPIGDMKSKLLSQQFSIGNSDLYPNTWRTSFQDHYPTRSLLNNKYDISQIDYLQPNNSTVKIGVEENPKQFLTSTKRDFTAYTFETSTNKSNMRNLIRASNILVL